ncbi:MAG: hypothetical protein U0326_27545 [Polyangiales bacterium]
MSSKTFPPAQPHGALREVFPDVFFVTGTVGLPGPLPVRFSRNMTVIREGERLTLVNSVRLTDDGLRELDKLGKVTDVVRLAGFHGMDDPFYKDRYGAKVWAVKGQRYTAGLNANAPETYFAADAEMDASTALPIKGASLYLYAGSKPPEGILVLDREGGIAIVGDSLQNWARPDEFFSLVAKVMMRFMGFIKPFNVGPGWLKQAKPSPEALRGVLALPFEHLLPSHGEMVRGGARAHYRPAIERAASK